MRDFPTGLRFFVPVEVVGGRDRNAIILASCGRQFTLPAALLEEVGDFGDAPPEVEAVDPPAAPAVRLTPAALKEPVFKTAPVMKISKDRLTWRLHFVQKVEGADGAEGIVPMTFEHVFAGTPSPEVEEDVKRALVEQARAWLEERGYGPGAPAGA